MTYARTVTKAPGRHAASAASVRAALRACNAAATINRDRLAALAAAFNLFGEPDPCPVP